MSTIAIENIRIFAYHGCFEEEQLIGTDFKVDVYLEVDTTEAEANDELDKTIDYQAVFMIVKEEMATPSKLIEHVGKRIMDRLFRDFPTIEEATVSVHKLNPPIGGQVGSVSVTLNRDRYGE